MAQECWNTLLETDWGPHLRQEFEKPYWAKLQAFVEDERTRHNVHPPCEDVFAALFCTSLADTKVVILGQDPYPSAGEAHGLAFSVRCGVKVPPSLRIIHRELHDDLGVPIPTHGNLEHWARRGVLLLNATLTVREGVPGSHQGQGWDTFTNRVIEVACKKTDVVFLLWGKEAQKKMGLLKNCGGKMIPASSPSPKAFYRGFRGSRPFSQANDALVAAGLGVIDWTFGDCPDSARGATK